MIEVDDDNPRQALLQIMRRCAKSSTYTEYQQQIHDIAMRGLGMSLDERAARHARAAEKSGDLKAIARVENWHCSRLLAESRARRAESTA